MQQLDRAQSQTVQPLSSIDSLQVHNLESRTCNEVQTLHRASSQTLRRVDSQRNSSRDRQDGTADILSLPRRDTQSGSLSWLWCRILTSPHTPKKGWASKGKLDLNTGLLLFCLASSMLLNSLWLLRGSPIACLGKEAPAPSAETTQSPLMIVGQPCSSPKLEDLRRHLGNVILIINTNYDFVAYNTSSFLRELYGRFFKEVVFIGPNSIPSLGVDARAHKPWKNRWCYAYYYFPTIVARFPKADGYLWMNDDVVLNYWTLLSADTDKLWLPDTRDCWKPEKEGCSGNVTEPEKCRCQGYVPFADGEKADILDGWSATLWHRKLVRQAWAAVEDPFKAQLAASLNTTKGYHKRVVDIFYVPRRLSMTMAFKLMPPFVEAAVWSEVAIPMMFHSMENPSKYDPIFTRMVYRWERRPDYSPLEFWNVSQSAYHHWKLASASGKRMLLSAFKEEDPCLDILSRKIEEGGNFVTKDDKKVADESAQASA